MSEPILKLKELLWEVTNRCNKACSYCGSRDILNQDDASFLIPKIVENIKKFPPETLTLTGGEPGCLLEKDIKFIINELQGVTKINVITNGEIFSSFEHGILSSINQIGISINTFEDMESFSSLSDKASKYYDSVTMITNFGTHNIWDFQMLCKFFDDFLSSPFWQVQLTMGEYQLKEPAIRYLRNTLIDGSFKKRRSAVRESLGGKGSIVLADNLQYSHTCSAGTKGCAITYDGLIIPCLSSRSWSSEDLDVQEQIKAESPCDLLQLTWQTKFLKNRFKEFKCCRDCIDYPCDKESVDSLYDELKGYAKSEVNSSEQPNTDVFDHNEFAPLISVYSVFQGED